MPIDKGFDPTETEFTSVPEDEQLDTDEDGSDNTDALDESTGDDTENVGRYPDRGGTIWRGE